MVRANFVRFGGVFMGKRLTDFLKRETVLCVAAVCALITMVLVPPDGEYWGYIDLRVLCLLLSLMAVVAGVKQAGLFRWLTYQLLRRMSDGRALSVTLVLLPFFCSMLVTNDVALLVFVPFSLALLAQLGAESAMIPILVLQTIGANLGSMATPVGNPQNLFLYANYHLQAGEFFSAIVPLTLVSLIVLAAAAVPVLPRALPRMELKEEKISSPRKLGAYLALFVLCLLTVFRIVPYWITTACVLVGLAWMDRKLLGELDFSLLATFVCFFLVSGNLGRVEAVRTCLQGLLEKSTLLTSAAASQIISNVPAAVLLSTFTDQWKPLLLGVNVGGLGTPIASLASLITLKLYLRWPGAKAGKYLALFTLENVVGLVVLLGISTLLL